MEGVDEYGCSARDAVAQAMKELVPRGTFEIPRRALNKPVDWRDLGGKPYRMSM